MSEAPTIYATQSLQTYLDELRKTAKVQKSS